MWIIWKVFIDALLLLMGFYFILSCLCHRLYLSLVFSIFVSLGKSFNESWWSVRIILFLVLSRQNISDVAPRKLPIYGLCWQSSMLWFFLFFFCSLGQSMACQPGFPEFLLAWNSIGPDWHQSLYFSFFLDHFCWLWPKSIDVRALAAHTHKESGATCFCVRC